MDGEHRKLICHGKSYLPLYCRGRRKNYLLLLRLAWLLSESFSFHYYTPTIISYIEIFLSNFQLSGLINHLLPRQSINFSRILLWFLFPNGSIIAPNCFNISFLYIMWPSNYVIWLNLSQTEVVMIILKFNFDIMQLCPSEICYNMYEAW